MNTLVINGLNEEDFRRSVENRLREGRAHMAIERLRSLLPEFARPGGLLPERFLTVQPSDLVLEGWDQLGDAIKRRDLPGRLITGISVAFGWPGEEPPLPDANGHLKPLIEVSYYSDSSFPFSKSSREDLLDGYSAYGCTWHGDAEASDNALSVDGIDDLHGALALLEARLLASDTPDEDSIRAGSLGACLLSALLVQAVKDQIEAEGLPRPVCVTAGSSDVYPYFDAPVAGQPDDLLEKEVELPPNVNGAPVPRYSSLLVTGIPRARKRAILVLEEDAEEMAERIAALRHHEPHAAPLTDHGQQPLPTPADEDAHHPLLAVKPVRNAAPAAEPHGLSPQPAARRTFPPTRSAPMPIPTPIMPEQAVPGPDLRERLQNLMEIRDEPAPPALVEPVAQASEPLSEAEDERGALARLRRWLGSLLAALLGR